MTNELKKEIGRVLALLHLTLKANHCCIADDNEGHLFIFTREEYEKNGKDLKKCDGVVVSLERLV